MEIRIHRAILRLMPDPKSCYYLICVCLYVLERPLCGYIKMPDGSPSAFANGYFDLYCFQLYPTSTD